MPCRHLLSAECLAAPVFTDALPASVYAAAGVGVTFSESPDAPQASGKCAKPKPKPRVGKCKREDTPAKECDTDQQEKATGEKPKTKKTKGKGGKRMTLTLADRTVLERAGFRVCFDVGCVS